MYKPCTFCGSPEDFVFVGSRADGDHWRCGHCGAVTVRAALEEPIKPEEITCWDDHGGEA